MIRLPTRLLKAGRLIYRVLAKIKKPGETS
jgi:hypothetical protein